MIKEEIIGELKGFKIYFDKKFEDILSSNYQKIIRDQISSHMPLNLENLLAAPNESLKLSPKFDDNKKFQNLYIQWGEADVGVFKKDTDMLRPKIEVIHDESLLTADQQNLITKKLQNWFEEAYIQKIALSGALEKINNTAEERSFVFKIIENNYGFYQSNILDEFKLINEDVRKSIHALNFRLGKNIIFNSEIIRPEFMKLKFYLWNIFNNENYSIDSYVPKDGNATLLINSDINPALASFLGFKFENALLIRLDIYNEFEKQLFKRENRGPFSLPMDLSNLLGIKKEKLIEILKNRSLQIQELGENDLVVSKKLNLKLIEKKKPTKKISNNTKKPPKLKPRQLFNNPFDQLKNVK